MKIQPVLKSCELQMENQHSPEMRCETLLSLLKAERENIKNDTLANRNFTADEFITDVDKNELRYELNYAILLLSDYPKTQSFRTAMPSKAYTKEFADKLNSIKDSVEAIINKYQIVN